MSDSTPSEEPKKLLFSTLPEQRAPDNPARPRPRRKAGSHRVADPPPPMPIPRWRATCVDIFFDGTRDGAKRAWAKIVENALYGAAVAIGVPAGALIVQYDLFGKAMVYINGESTKVSVVPPSVPTAPPYSPPIETGTIKKMAPTAKPKEQKDYKLPPPAPKDWKIDIFKH